MSEAFLCNDCREMFDSPAENHTCPACGGDDIEIVTVCQCGKPCEGGHEWCPDCLNALGMDLQELAEKYGTDYCGMRWMIDEYYCVML